MTEALGKGRLADRCLYLCTPDRPDLEAFVDRCVAGGVDVVQLRDKSLDARPLLARAVILRRLCSNLGVPFILNDRPDLALECDADGVHVGQDDTPPALARRILGPDRIVGLSTHRPSEFANAYGASIDYASVGPVVETPTKPGRPGTGVEFVSEAARITRERSAGGRDLPFFVTGGVSPDTITDLWRAGARRFVVVRYLTEADNPKARAAELIRAIDQARKSA